MENQIVKDIEGIELKVGDEVYYGKRRGYGAKCELKKLIITRISPKGIVSMGKYRAKRPNSQLLKINIILSEHAFNRNNDLRESIKTLEQLLYSEVYPTHIPGIEKAPFNRIGIQSEHQEQIRKQILELVKQIK